MLVFLLNLFLTAFVYLLVPTIYCIIGKPLTKVQIKRIVIINGICTWLIFTFVRSILDNPGTSASVFLWSFIADRIMTSRLLTEDKNVEKDNVEEQDFDEQNVEEKIIVDQSIEYQELTITEPDEQENISDSISQMDNVIITSKPMFCPKCCGKLTEDGLFCQYCGNKIVSEKSPEIELKKNEWVEESKSDFTVNNTVVAKSTTKKKMQFTWLWVLLIIVNCFVAFVSTSESIHSLLFYIEKRAIISWCYHNIDPIYEIGYTQQEYVAAMRDNTEAIMLFAIVALLFVLLFVAISLVNTYICRRKLNVKRKLIKSLPWLCTLILTIVLCGSLTLYYVVEYADDIEYSYRRVEEEQAELEKKYIEEQKKEETQKLASQLLYSSIKPEMPNEVFENAQRYPKKVEGELVKVSGYVNVSDTFHYFIEESASSNRQILKFTYGLKSENSPNILDGDFVTIVGKIIEVRSNIKYDDAFSRLLAVRTYGTSGDLVVVEIYDWIIVD